MFRTMISWHDFDEKGGQVEGYVNAQFVYSFPGVNGVKHYLSLLFF